ncbi:MAG: DUF2807 domain-containing protein [Psychroflexus sp.]|nr:DUF2807 domain-containing protein [Psychroflexus sp.]MDN6310918.1 DUF2807 domain-containing protein [Psychroflexus sp.]
MLYIVKHITYAIIAFSFLSCQSVSKITGNEKIDDEGPVITKEIEINQLKKIAISNAWDVHLIKSQTSKAVITSHQNIIDLTEISTDKNELEISFDKQIGKVKQKQIDIYYTHQLEDIRLSATAELQAENPLTLGQLKLKVSSTAKANLKLNADMLTLDVSSSAYAKLSGTIEESKLNASSGSTLKLELTAKKIEASASSGSDIQLNGSTDYLEVSASSGSGIDASGLTAKNITATASSGASLKIDPQNKLNAKASSGSSIKYYTSPKNIEISKSSDGRVSHQ